MVGSHTVDLMSVYLREEHELYRTWVALVDLEEEDDHGAQGYMKLSITVLGPGDTQAVHNLEASVAVASEFVTTRNQFGFEG